MKNLIKIVICTLFLFLGFREVVFADNPYTVEVEVQVSDEKTKVEITGDRFLPKQTILTGSGKFILTYDDPQVGDEYIYQVTQLKEDDMLLYDERIYEIRVHVFMEDGIKKISAFVYKIGSDEKLDLITFANTQIKPIYVDPPVKKVVEGHDPIKVKYEFAMKALDGAPMQKDAVNGEKHVYIEGQGETEFGKIEFSKPGIYKYEVWEINTKADNITYDTSKYTLEFTVTKDSNNELKVSERILKNSSVTDKVVFTNIYKKPTTPPAIIREFIRTGSGKVTIAVGSILILAVATLLALKKFEKGNNNE